MRRRTPPSPADAFIEVERLMKQGLGLELLRQKMGADATRLQALRLRRKLMQLRRTPSKLLDDELGITRD